MVYESQDGRIANVTGNKPSFDSKALSQNVIIFYSSIIWVKTWISAPDCMVAGTSLE
jgi:hypothetical protein